MINNSLRVNIVNIHIEFFVLLCKHNDIIKYQCAVVDKI